MSKFKNKNFNFSNFGPQHPAAHGIVSREKNFKKINVNKYFKNFPLNFCKNYPNEIAYILIYKYTLSDINYYSLKLMLLNINSKIEEYYGIEINNKCFYDFKNKIIKIENFRSLIISRFKISEKQFQNYLKWNSINTVLKNIEYFEKTNKFCLMKKNKKLFNQNNNIHNTDL